MKYDRYDYKEIKSNQDYLDNTNALRFELAGISCNFVGKIEAVADCIAKELLNDQEYISGIEVYSNGAMNMFIRDLGASTAKGFIRVRPD